VAIPRSDALNVGEGDFTVSAWIHPTLLRKSAIAAMGGDETHGWYLDLADNRGTVRLETFGWTTSRTEWCRLPQVRFASTRGSMSRWR
jgi:hypothetical protein